MEEIYQISKPSVVQIKAIKISEGFFGPEKQTSAQGSGFVYDDSGHIITNQHVVEEAEEIQVRFYNGETVKANLVGADPYSDIAVLKIKDPSNLDVYLHSLQLGILLH